MMKEFDQGEFEAAPSLAEAPEAETHRYVSSSDRALMTQYKEVSGRCDICQGTSIDGCTQCRLGKILRAKAWKLIDNDDGWKEWESAWGQA